MESKTDQTSTGGRPNASMGGLTDAEAAKRLKARPPFKLPSSSRSYASIVTTNVFTVFNAILVFFGVVTLMFGDWRDSLFLSILVVNTGIGISQEIRAKRSLERLAALVSPKGNVLREGRTLELPPNKIVNGDYIRLQSGDQAIADGELITSQGLRLDESILTGESASVSRESGDEIRSGSFAVEGAGLYEVSAVGPESYAERIAAHARVYQHQRSPLERGFNQLLLLLVVVMVPLASILGYSLSVRNTTLSDAVTTSTAAVVSLIPEGLIVLMSITFAVGALRMARQGALAQRINAIESLAGANVVCFDKTGTLTESGLKVAEIVPAADSNEEEFQAALGRYAASSAVRNSTLSAIGEAYEGESEDLVGEVPFASSRRWSAIQLHDVTYVLGAPELFELDDELDKRLKDEQNAGRRAIALAESDSALNVSSSVGAVSKDDQKVSLPKDVKVLGLVILTEPLRADARETVQFFTDQGIDLRVLSGDHPATVGAIAREVGIGGDAPAIDGSKLPEDPDELRELALNSKVFGRISPDGKQAVVTALRESGRYVAMVGDGVNDVPALKAARLSIAQGSGVQMAKSVSDIVLVSGDFSAVPEMVHEGRKILRNLRRVAKLFVSKSCFAAFLILTLGTTATAYPLLPRHFTLAAAVTIGIPTFFLALAPSRGPWAMDNLIRDIGRFAVPGGVAAGVAVVASYQFALHVIKLPLIESRTVAITALVSVGFFLILALEGIAERRGKVIILFVGSLVGVYVLALILPFTRKFFELAPPNFEIISTALVGALIAIFGLLASGFPQGQGSISKGEMGVEAERHEEELNADGNEPGKKDLADGEIGKDSSKGELKDGADKVQDESDSARDGRVRGDDDEEGDEDERSAATT